MTKELHSGKALGSQILYDKIHFLKSYKCGGFEKKKLKNKIHARNSLSHRNYKPGKTYEFM
jgi:hypothetical protein